MKKSFSKKTRFLLILLFSIFLVIPSNASANEYCRMIDEDDLVGLPDTILGCVDIEILKAAYSDYKDMTAVKTCNTYITDLGKHCSTVSKATFCNLYNNELKKSIDWTNIDKHECVVYDDKATCENTRVNSVKCGLTKSDIQANIDAMVQEVNLKTPSPAITIPGLELRDINKTFDAEGNLNIPWIGQYISAVYNFALVAFSILAVLMILMQGLTILTGGGWTTKETWAEGVGSKQTTQGAYKKIGQIVIGLVLAWLSYAILFTINPDLVRFETIKMIFVKRVSVEELNISEDLQNYEGVTMPATDSSKGVTMPATDSSISMSFGSYKPAFTSCPLKLTKPLLLGGQSKNPALDPRNHEFFDQIEKVLTGTTKAEKIKQVADALVVCQAHFGSCGRTAGTIYTLAGITSKKYPKSCLLKTSTGCMVHEPYGGATREVFGIKGKLWGNFKNFRCGRTCSKVKADPPGCANTNSDARIKLFEYLRKQPKLAKQGYPDSWLVKIKPGDTLWTYTGFGGSCSGLHSVTFVGWASDGVAQVVNGQYKKKAWYGTVCLKSTCGKRITPLVKVFRPK